MSNTRIPPLVLERGERAFVRVLRSRYPDATFVVRDDTAPNESTNGVVRVRIRNAKAEQSKPGM